MSADIAGPAAAPAGQPADVLLRMSVGDWRKADGMDDELVGLQAEDWTLEIIRGGYAGINLVFTAPDGSRRDIVVEIDRGNVTLTTYRDNSDPDARITLTANETHVTSSNPPLGRQTVGYAFDENGDRRTSDQAEPGFREQGPTP